MIKYLRRYFIAGLLVWVPLGITLFVASFLIGAMDGSLNLLPETFTTWLNDSCQIPLLGKCNVPGLGAVLTLLILLVTGMLTANIVGRQLVRFGERLLDRIPLVRTLYSGAKNFAEIVLAPSSESFKKVLLIQYPRKGVWSLAFQTSTGLGQLDHAAGEELVCTFVPTTPNPTSGFIILVPKKDVIELDMDIDAALKMIISLGVIVPVWKPSKISADLADPEARS